MIKLLRKEILLTMHPTVPIMLLLVPMVLIPNYPYSVIFFYMTLAIFFTCLTGRENADVIYSMTLPIAKKDIVKGRFAFAILVELLQLIFLIPFILLRGQINSAPNAVGMEANLVLLANGFIVFGLFNWIFFSTYYKDVSKVGMSFVKASAVLFLWVVVEVCATYAIPFVREYLDTTEGKYLSYHLMMLVIGILIYSLLTGVTLHLSLLNFDKQNIQ